MNTTKRQIAMVVMYLLAALLLLTATIILPGCTGSRYFPEEYYRDAVTIYQIGGGVYVIEKDTVYKQGGK